MTLEEKMPAKLCRLPELAYNLWWSWTPEARAVFKELDFLLWRSTQHNPVLMMHQMSQEQLEAKANDPVFARRYTQALLRFDAAMSKEQGWFAETYPGLKKRTVAYFSMEFGLHSSLPIYSGGLGILSGDHTKEASDLGLPLVGVGFVFPQGYFRQRIPPHGWQEAFYQQLDFTHAPIRPVLDNQGNPILIKVPLAGKEVFAGIWLVQVGRTSLYLMDTDVEQNSPWERELSARLYAGDSEMRIRQEIMLGVGGVRLLRQLGIHPSAWHINEGHAAFLQLECIREKVQSGLSFADAVQEVRKQTVFTTHTPVPAGHDVFPFHIVEHYFGNFWEEMGISRQEFLSLGEHQEPWGRAFNMTVLAFRLSGKSNGVSKLHGEVTRNMWHHLWPQKTREELPITHVTNGVHVPTWISSELGDVYNKYLGRDWREKHDDPTLWERVKEIPADELWNIHLELKRKMFYFLRERVRERWLAGTYDPIQVLVNGRLLDPYALTIGFARRFATYKRSTLLFRDMDRLRKILLDSYRPVQLVIAGKAHPADDPGKRLIQEIYDLAKNHKLGGRVAFIEDYDMHMARYLTQGVDLWLNTPRRPREASGTSGMKAALNGIPNLSVLDGWWMEGYNGANGWAIGSEKSYPSVEEQDQADADSLYELLEQEVVPLFYDRDRDGVPRGWVGMMREAIRSNAPRFSMRSMIKEYANKLYVPAMNGSM